MPKRYPFPDSPRKVEELSDAEFKKAVKKKGITVVSVKREDCGWCPEIAPTIDKIAKENAGVGVFRIDVDKAPKATEALRIQNIPTVIFLKNGKEIKRVVGADPARIEKTLGRLLR